MSFLSPVVNDADRAIDKGYAVGPHPSPARLEPLLTGEPGPWDRTELARSQEHDAALGPALEVAS